jgi:hypothetical protein
VSQENMVQLPSPSRLMWLLFNGFALSLGYGLACAGIIYLADGTAEAASFLAHYIDSFNILVTLGLITATALIVHYAQYLIPDTIEATFEDTDLWTTSYLKYKQRFFSLKRTVIFAAEFLIIGFLIFHFCHFPLRPLGEACLIIGGCLQWLLASYVGRKLRYASMMLYALLNVHVASNLFRERKLDLINTCVNIASTLTILFVYLHVRSFYNGPFLYDSFLGKSAQILLLLQAVLATPVLLMFNFFPREVIRKIYDKSIDIEIQSVESEIKGDAMSDFEKRLRLLELGKMYREEMRYSLKLTLSDLPIGVTILIMVAEPLIRR